MRNKEKEGQQYQQRKIKKAFPQSDPSHPCPGGATDLKNIKSKQVSKFHLQNITNNSPPFLPSMCGLELQGDKQSSHYFFHSFRQNLWKYFELQEEFS